MRESREDEEMSGSIEESAEVNVGLPKCEHCRTRGGNVFTKRKINRIKRSEYLTPRAKLKMFKGHEASSKLNGKTSVRMQKSQGVVRECVLLKLHLSPSAVPPVSTSSLSNPKTSFVQLSCPTLFG